MSKHLATMLLTALISCLPGFAFAADEETLAVTACAYTLDGDQTDDSEDIGAWGDELDDESRTIAVSRDLLKMGMKRGTKVRIHGRPGEYIVKDLMHPRWEKRIDILMDDEDAAFDWGRRKVKITWNPPAGQKTVADKHKKPAPKTLNP